MRCVAIQCCQNYVFKVSFPSFDKQSFACRSIIRPKDEPLDKLVVKTLLESNLCIHMWIYWPWPVFLPGTMTVTQKLFKILSRLGFCINCYCDLDSWPTYLNIYRGHLLTMTNLHTKFNDCHSETFQVIEQTRFCINCFCDLDLDLVASTCIGSTTEYDQFSYQLPCLSLRNVTMPVTQIKCFKILSGHGFWIL